MSLNENYFIGARVLSEEEVLGILPNYQSVFDEIQSVREISSQNRDAASYLKRKQINNTFTILGERGTGKTSVLYTIIDKLEREKEDNKDILFDFIEPLNISQESDIIGVILSLLQEQMEQLFKEISNNQRNVPDSIKDKFFKDCIFKKNNELQEKFDKLMEFYLYLQPRYRQLLVQNYSDLNSYIKKSTLVLNADTGFQKRFMEFVDSFLKYYREVYNTDKDKEPLLFFVFDDIDLCPEKTGELLNTILKYMGHPNIVCFMAGDYTGIKYELQLDFIRKESVSGGGLALGTEMNGGNADTVPEDFFSTLYKKKGKLAEDYLIKILPSPRRFQLNMWKNSTKPYFVKTLKDESKLLLGDLLRQIVQISTGEELDGIFMDVEKENGIVYADVAFGMLPNRTRELNNIMYSAQQLLWVLQKENIDEAKIVRQVQRHLQSIFDYSVSIRRALGDNLNEYIVFGKSFKDTIILMDKIQKIFYQLRNRQILRNQKMMDSQDVLYFTFYVRSLLRKEEQEYQSLQASFMEAVIKRNPFKINDYLEEKDLKLEEYYITEFICHAPFNFSRWLLVTIEKSDFSFDDIDEEIIAIREILYSGLIRNAQPKKFAKWVYEKTEECEIWEQISDWKEDFYMKIWNNFSQGVGKIEYMDGTKKKFQSNVMLKSEITFYNGVIYQNYIYNNESKFKEIYQNLISEKDENITLDTTEIQKIIDQINNYILGKNSESLKQISKSYIKCFETSFRDSFNGKWDSKTDIIAVTGKYYKLYYLCYLFIVKDESLRKNIELEEWIAYAKEN